MKRMIGIVVATIAGILLLYLSRFWVFSLWSRDGLLGIKELRPGGGLLARWLRGTDFAPLELIIWAILVFLALTYLQRIMDRLQRK